MATVQLVLTMVGGLCEVVGFSWTMAEASAARSREYGEPGFFRRIYRWFAYWLGEPGESVMLQGMSATATSSVGTPTVSTFSDEADVERLRREVTELRKEMERLHQHYEEKFSNVDRRLGEFHSSTNQRIDRLEQQQR